MAKNRPTHVSKPVYPGGLAAMKKFVAQHLKYPKAAMEAKVEGTVLIRYGLDYRGKVTDVKVKKGLGHGCDEEALRVVKLLRFTVPQNNKKKVRIHQDINIHFKLPKQKPKKAGNIQQVNISYTASSGKVSGKVVGKPPQPGGGYTYTIEW
ncbi:energy transducer TonB [Neolewinella persica]|uniref:energy transducer TonB n=1 Tax=Neolewinella persica TaxID=70998 RepID=UPI00037AF0BF|nr:energy transducer TonB [Neolewinella persica]